MRVAAKQKFTQPNTLTISNWEFLNFFHDINAIVNTNQYGSLMTISNSIFSRVSNWGSVIKNYNSYPISAGTEVTDKFADKKAYFNYRTLSIMLNKAKVYHGSDMTVNPFLTACASTDCFRLTIQNSQFTYLGAFKKLLTGMNIVPEIYQRYQAMALNLVNFKGDVTLKSNTFTKNYVMIDGWVQVQSLPSPPPTNTKLEYLGATATLYQIKSLISIMSHSRLILLGENAFTDNVGTKGIVMLEKTKQKQYPIFIIGNTFTTNSGFLYSDTLYIRTMNDNIYNPNLVQAQHFCAGIYMASNTFTNNVGWAATTLGTVVAYCFSSVDPAADDYYTKDKYLDHQTLVAKTPPAADQTKFLNTINFSSYTLNQYTLVYGGSYGTINFNMEKVIITSSSFTSNYGGRNGAILTLEGFPNLELTSTTFQNNGNNIPDFAYLYSPIVKSVQSSSSTAGLFRLSSITDTTLSVYSNKMKAIVNIDISNTMVFSNLNFINNWIIGQGVTTAVSHSLLLRNVYKSFSWTNWVFRQNKGISNDPVLTTSPNTVNFSSITKGMTRPLINFDTYFFR